MRILVTGGAGYIGSYVSATLSSAGHEVVVVDDLSNGHADAVQPPARIVVSDAGGYDEDAEVIVHLASRIGVGDAPQEHWLNNVGTTLRLLEHTGARRIVFASSAAVYGEPSVAPIHEDAELRPMSAYGQTKVAIEQMLAGFDIEWTALRLFNVAGGRERHKHETHLLPLALRNELTLYGSGDMVRDFVHVQDVADAFALAVEGPTGIYNIGSGVGTMVVKLLDCVGRVTGRPVEVKHGPPRKGDPQRLVSDIARARTQLGWSPKFGLEDIVRSAL
jgi:UDP-glucose 4-epimerase